MTSASRTTSTTPLQMDQQLGRTASRPESSRSLETAISDPKPSNLYVGGGTIDNGDVADVETQNAVKATAGHAGTIEEEVPEKPIDLTELPHWRSQLTFRACGLGAILGGVFCIITHNLNLKTGVIPSLNIAAGLLGFFFLKLYTEVMQKLGFKVKPFTAQENTVVQTTVVACYGIAFYGGFGSYLLGMTPNVQKRSGATTPGTPGYGPSNIHDIDLSVTIPYMLLIGFTGIFVLTVLRKLMVVDYRLPYPSGTATGILINSFHTKTGEIRAKKQVRMLGKWFAGSFCFSLFKWFFSSGQGSCSGGFGSFPSLGRRALTYTWNFDFSQTYIGAGIICPHIVDWSIMLGAILSQGIQFPLIKHHRAGVWYPKSANTSSSFNGLGAYEVFPALAIFIGDGGYNLVKMLVISGRQLYRDHKAKQSLPAHSRHDEMKLRGQVGNNLVETTAERTARTTLFVTEKIPTWIPYTGYACFAALATGLVPQIFPQVKWYYVLTVELVAPLFAVCNAYGMGLTDWNVASTYAKLCIFLFAAWAGNQTGIVAGLGIAGVMFGGVGAAADLMQDFRTGYLTMASPKSMFCAQLWGMLSGCVLAPLTFLLIAKGSPDIGLATSQYPAPYALAYRGIAVVGAEGLSALPDNCLLICMGWFFGAIFVSMMRDFLPKRYGRYVPIPMAMAIPFLVGAALAIDMCIGSIILFVWQKVNRLGADTYGAAFASGLIVGDGIWTIVSSILGVANQLPPVCMQFFNPDTADAAYSAANALSGAIPAGLPADVATELPPLITFASGA